MAQGSRHARAPLTSDGESSAGPEQEQPEPERLAAPELDVAAAAGADPVEELPDAGLIRVLRRVALAVEAPRPLVAVEVVDARGDRVQRRQPDVGRAPDRARVVLELVPRRTERLEVLARRLAAPVAVAVEDEAARSHEPGERRELRRRADACNEVEGAAAAVPRLDVGDDHVDARRRLREELRVTVDADGVDLVPRRDAPEQVSLAAAEIDDPSARRQ